MTDTQSQLEHGPGPVGIGGWLILPLLLLVIVIVGGCLQLTVFLDLVEAAAMMSSAQRNVLSTQVVLNALVNIVCPVILLVYLVRKKLRFPRLFVIWAIAFVVFAIVNRATIHLVYATDLSLSLRGLFTLETLQSLLLSVLPVIVFIPYVLQSRRVANTFVN